MQFISEKVVKPNLSNYKIPQDLLYEDYKFYHITVKYDDLTALRRIIYNIPVYVLQKDKMALQYTNSKRKVPQGLCLINQYQQIINNMMSLHLPDQDQVDGKKIIIKMQNSDTSDKIVAYNISWNKQFCGYLLPNQILNESFIVKKMLHFGIQIATNFKKNSRHSPQSGLGPQSNEEGDKTLTFISLYPWEYIEEQINKLDMDALL